VTDPRLFAVCGVVLFGMGLYEVVVAGHLVRRLIALNLMSAGVFLVLVTLGSSSGGPTPGVSSGGPTPGVSSGGPTPGSPGDPVPHAMVLTGLVVSISATALGLTLVRRLHAETGHAQLPDVPTDMP
jgi:multicomponent Na+:H+ antiporter subunit C